MVSSLTDLLGLSHLGYMTCDNSHQVHWHAECTSTKKECIKHIFSMKWLSNTKCVINSSLLIAFLAVFFQKKILQCRSDDKERNQVSSLYLDDSPFFKE